MDNLRFFGIAAAFFAIGFLGLQWLAAGGPLPIPVLVEKPMRPDPRVPTFEQAVERGRAKQWLDDRTSQGDSDPVRDKLRLEALQAANAYTMSPCDAGNKKRLVDALKPYLQARIDIAGCTGAFCPSDGLDKANAVFSTSFDTRVMDALEEAFEQGGITKTDFPSAMQPWAMAIAHAHQSPQCDPTGERRRPKPERRVDDRPTAQTSSRPPRIPTSAQTSDPWAHGEDIRTNVREYAQKSAVKALEQPWSEFCNPEGRKRLRDALSYYFGQRQTQMRVYAQWGDASVRHGEHAWATSNDLRIERMFQESVSRGYVVPDDLSADARSSAAKVAGKVPATKACKA